MKALRGPYRPYNALKDQWRRIPRQANPEERVSTITSQYPSKTLLEATQADMADDQRCLAFSELLKTEHSGIMLIMHALIMAEHPVYF